MIETLARIAKMLGAAAFGVAILGFMGTAYCDYNARQSPLSPDIISGHINPINFKGQRRYVSDIDAEICGVSLPVMFVAAALGAFLNGFYVYVFRRFP